MVDTDKVFKALADPSRREVLDRLHAKAGLTLVELCEGMNMTRQSLTQHLGLLEDANLISFRRQGREKLHYLNPVPIHEIYTRWIGKFEQSRLQALHNLKQALQENTMTNPEFVYTIYIKTTPEKVWAALTTPEFSRQYWIPGIVSDWKKGSKWNRLSEDGKKAVTMAGEILESTPPKRLVLTWFDPSDPADDSRVTFSIDAIDDMVRLTVIHGDFKADSNIAGKISIGWPRVLSSMKSFLETGKALGTCTDCANPAKK